MSAPDTQASEPAWVEHDGSAVCPVPAGHDVEVRHNEGSTSRHNYPEGRCWERGYSLITHYRDWTAFAQASEGAVGEVENPPAFPGASVFQDGMTLRDWFAGQAMPEVMRQMHAHPDGWTDDEAAQVSYDMADAMLRARLPAAAVAAVEGEG